VRRVAAEGILTGPVRPIPHPRPIDTAVPASQPSPSSGLPPIDMGRDVVDTEPTPAPERSAALAAPSARPTTFVDVQIRHAAEAFQRGGLGGLDSWMRQSPAEARWILSVPRSELRSGLHAELASRPGYRDFLGSVRAFGDAHAVDAHLADLVQPQIREAVRQTAVGRIDAMTRGLESSSPEQLASAPRPAPAGSGPAALAGPRALRGDPMDAERVQGWQRRALHELHELRETVMGQTWMPEELPGSMAHVQQAMGLERCTPGSIAGQAFSRGAHAADARAHAHETAIDGTIVAAEGTHVALEALHVAGRGGVAALAADATLAGAAGGLAVGLGGLAFGYMLHHQIEENRAERTETARSLGL